MGASKVYLPDTENGYKKWMESNQRGYVVNAPRSAANRQAMVWHRADCKHLQPNGKSQYVEGADLKACSLDPGALAEWAFSYGRALDYCETCRAKSETDL